MEEALAVLPIGTVIEGRYRIDRVVGSGGFGTVHAGWQVAIDLPIAVKVLRLDGQLSSAKRSELLSHFVDEARVIGRLRHDCIVRTLDQGIVQDALGLATPYLVMEWGGDETLRDLLRSTGRSGLPLSVAWPIFSGIVDAVAHAHDMGIAHRDLKPGNVMIARKASRVTPRIIDFGIAKLFEDGDSAGSGATRTRSTTSPYTPGYAAPEQIASARTGPWTDVHALALMFVEMVTGKPPYGDHAMDGLAAIDPVRPTPRAFGVDVGPFEPVLATALSLRPSARYRDAGAFSAALSAAAATLGLEARPAAGVIVPPATGDSSPVGSTADRSDRGAAMQQTVRVDATPEPHAGMPFPLTADQNATSRRLFVAGGVALGAAALGGAGWALLRHRSPVPEAPNELASSVESASSAAPTGPPGLGDLTIAELEARSSKAGLVVQTRTALANPRQFMLSFELENVWGTVHLVDFQLPYPTITQEALQVALLPYIGSVVRNYRDTVQGGVAYGVSKHTMLLVCWKVDPRTIAFFDAIVAGMELSLRGNTITGPDPATQAAAPRVEAPDAKKLVDLSANELRTRLLRTGAVGVKTASVGPSPVVLSFVLNQKKGELTLFLPPPASLAGAADAHQAMLSKRKRPHAFAKEGGALLVCEGEAGFDAMAALRLVVAGLEVKVEAAR